MNFEFTDEQNFLRQTFKDFCGKELTNEYSKWLDENVDFIPDELWQKFNDIGFFELCIDEKYGGSGGSFTDCILAGEEIATANVSVAMCVMGPVNFGMHVIGGMGTEEQKNHLLPKIANGELKFSLAMTETGGGTDVLNALKTTAVKKGDNYIINGHKIFITAGHVANYMLVAAITDPQAIKRHNAISTFLVDAKTPGIKVNLIQKLGMRACGTTEVFFDNVVVPESCLLGELNKGWITLKGVMNPERITTSLFSLGIAKAAFKASHEYSLQRYAFGKPIGQFMALQHYFADMLIEIENARNLIYKCCWMLENGIPYHIEAVMAKVVAGRASEIAAIKGMEILGGYGYCMEYEMQRHFRDYKQMIFSPISDEMAKNMIAKWSGLPKSY